MMAVPDLLLRVTMVVCLLTIVDAHINFGIASLASGLGFGGFERSSMIILFL